jgi:uncharacterized membrane protein YccC
VDTSPTKPGMRYAFVIVTAGIAVVLGLLTETLLSIIVATLFARVSGLLIACLFVGIVLETVWSNE